MTGRNPLIAIGLFAAVVSFALPNHRAPVDYDEILWLSLPLSLVWTLASAVCLRTHGKRGAWILLGLPFALFYPATLLIFGIPPCYWSGTCHFR